MYCRDCHKFVSFDSDVDPEIDLDITGDQVSGDVRIVNGCAECGTELQEAQFSVNENIDGHAGHAEKCDGELSVDVSESARTDRLLDKTPEGKPIKGRFKKRLYGAEAIFKVACDKCEFDEEISWSDEIRSSDMDACG